MQPKVKGLLSLVEQRAIEGAKTFLDQVESGEITSYMVICEKQIGDVRVMNRGKFERDLLAAIGACKHGADVLNDLLKSRLFEQFGHRDPIDEEADG